MQGIRARDPEALAALYDRYSGLVLAVCQRAVGNRADAEEVLEEVFWEIWQRADRYDPLRASPRSYLLMVSRSRAIDRARQLGRRPRTTSLAVAEVHALGQGPPPSGRIEAADLAHRVRLALATLEPEARRLVELSFFQGLSHREISEQLGQPLGTVKTRIRRSLLHLRKTLQNLGEETEAS